MLAKNMGKICVMATNYRAFALKLASLNSCGSIPGLVAHQPFLDIW
jgi:hypothetical protein